MKKLILMMIALVVAGTALPALAQLDPTEAEDLLLMREEEKLARDTYLTLYDLWGSNTFANIARSEQRHMDTMEAMLQSYGLPDPVVDDTVGVFANATLAGYYDELVQRGAPSLLDALHVGAFIEELDIADLRTAIDRSDEPPLINAYENLLAGSRNHLRAFVSQISLLGVTYTAQVLAQDDVDAIVGGYDLPASDSFTINAGLNDAWFYPATNGQGFFIVVYPVIGQVFLSWFTYETELPDAAATAHLGVPEHRWLTAQGPYDGAQAELEIFVSSGGVFDTEDPPVVNTSGGSILLQFEDCNSGSVTYDIPSIGRTGVIPIQRIVTDNVAHCEKLAGTTTGN
jgi:hypothetical protein